MPDPYTNPDSQPDSAIQAMITRLEERGQNSAFSRMIRTYVETLNNESPLKALDLGCGTGVVTRQLAIRLHPSSEIHGADVSASLLEEAQKLSSSNQIKWDHVEAGRLPYPDETFDAIMMHTLLSHVPSPIDLLIEAKRILKKDGQLIVFDADHAGTTYGHPDYETMRRINHLLSSAIAAQPDACRQMPRYLKQAGFKLNRHQADVISECGTGDYWLSSVRGFARLLPTLNILPPEEAKEWVEQMLNSHNNGTFFASGVFYTFYASPAE